MLDSRIKLRHIRCFLEVARRRSLAKAAEALALSQPAVTKTLQELEAVLGVALIERSRLGAELTSFGEVFLPRAAACIIELESAVDSVAQVRTRLEWTVRVGALPTVAARMMPTAIQRFRDQGAEAIVQIVTGPNAHLLELLRNDELDIVVGRLAAPERMSDLSFIHLYSEPVRFVVRAGHPLAGASPFDASRIVDFPIIIPDSEAVIRPAVDRLLITLGIGALPNRIESVSTSFGRAFTSDTDAIWIISEGVVARDLERGAMTILDVDTSDTSGPVGLTTRADGPSNPGIELLKQAIRWSATAR
jgi:LysR family pca operon transcriptional activator